jgi:predicted HTH domain antitoxin
MAQRSLTVTIPDVLARELDVAFLLELLERGMREVRVDRALELYSRGDVSFGAAAEHAGVSQSDLARYAYARGFQPPASSETLAEELG